MNGTTAGEDEEGTKSPRSRSPAMGVPVLALRDHHKASGDVEDEGRRGSSGGGILRLDPTKPRRSSAASVEFKATDKDDPSSPCPSDRLSVTWADGERSVSSDAPSVLPRGQVSPDPAASITTQIPAIGSLLDQPVHEEEDMSASVTAILRRSSTRGSRRSSKKKKKMRRTSTMTTSSGETVVEVEGLSEEEEVAETLRIHKEVLAGVKLQPWPIARKLRLARASREYIDRHEGQLEERLAQSSSTKDVLMRYFIRVRRVVRAGLSALYVWVSGLEAWQGRIKTIESHFGSAVASYFTFLRWVLGLNIVLALLLGAFVIIPELLAADKNDTGERKSLLLGDERRTAYDFKVMWDFNGIMRYTPIFYGYYSKAESTKAGYRLPLAYFLTSIIVYVYSFVAILRKMAANSRMSKLSEDEEYTFTWRVLAGWDFTIGNMEAAQNKVAAINNGFREALLEAQESEKEEKSWKLRGRRVLAHFLVVLLVAGSVYAVILFVGRQEGAGPDSSWWRQNELTVILNLISIIYPKFFDMVGLLEQRHPRNQLQWQLARIMTLNLLNLYTLILALFSKVDDMTHQLKDMKTNVTALKDSLSFTSSPDTTDNSLLFGNVSSTDEYGLTDDYNITLADFSNSSSFNLSESDLTDFTDSFPAFNLSDFDIINSTLAPLITAALFTSVPISKTDPSLQSSPPPGCYRIPAPCLTSTQSLPNFNSSLPYPLTSPSSISNSTDSPLLDPLTVIVPTSLLTSSGATSINSTVTPVEDSLFEDYYGRDYYEENDDSDYLYDYGTIQTTLHPQSTTLTENITDNPHIDNSTGFEEEGWSYSTTDSTLLFPYMFPYSGNYSTYGNASINETGNDISSDESTNMTSISEYLELNESITENPNEVYLYTSTGSSSIPDNVTSNMENPVSSTPTSDADGSLSYELVHHITARDINKNENDEYEKWESYNSEGGINKRNAESELSEYSLDLPLTDDQNLANERRQDSGGRVKRVVDYDDRPNLGIGRPSLGSIATIEKPPVISADDVEEIEDFDEVTNITTNNITSEEENKFITPGPYDSPNITSRSLSNYWDSLIDSVTNNQNPTTDNEESSTTTEFTTEPIEAETGNMTENDMALNVSISEAENVNVTNNEDLWNATDDEGDADEEYGCIITVCDGPIDMTTPPIPSETSTSYPSSVEPPTTPVWMDTVEPQTTLEYETTTDVSCPSLDDGFLVQKMKDNPENYANLLEPEKRKQLRKLCWETMFGQEIVKLTVMDLAMTVAQIVCFEYIRAVVVRLFNGNWCCWDLEKKFPGYPDFSIAENILQIVNNQGMIWMGMFFAPGLPAINALKLLILMYVRSWAVVTSNVPPETVFKASNNNNFYLMFLLAMLFLCTLPVGYAVVALEPSWHCGPFSDWPKIYQYATSTLIGGLPSTLHPVIDYISSPGVVIPAGLLLILIIYYLVSLTTALREANSDLRDQLRHERSAEKRKAQDARSSKNRPETPTTRWGKVVPLTPMPRLRLNATSDPEKAFKKSPSALSPESEGVPAQPNGDAGKCRDEGPWPDDVTDLGHSEVFDDSLSETKKPGRDLEGPVFRQDRRMESVDTKGHKDSEIPPKSPHVKKKSRKNSYPPPDDDTGGHRGSRGRHRSSGSQTRPRQPQDRKLSDESICRDSPTKVKYGHRQYADSPRERRRSSGSQSKLRYKPFDSHKQEVNEVVTQKEAPKQQSRSPRVVGKVEPQRSNTEPETLTRTSSRHRREQPILKLDDLRRNSQGRREQNQSKIGTKPSHHRSSSEDSQSLHTIPVIKISKEDSVERSLQQAKLQRQDKTQDPEDITSDQQSVSTSDTTPLLPSEVVPVTTSPSATVSPSPPSDKKPSSTNISSSSPSDKGPLSSSPSEERERHTGQPIEMKTVTKESSRQKMAPTETNLDDPCIMDLTPTQDHQEPSDTTALLKEADDVESLGHLATEEPSSIMSSDDEATLLEEK